MNCNILCIENGVRNTVFKSIVLRKALYDIFENLSCFSKKRYQNWVVRLIHTTSRKLCIHLKI